MLSRILSIALAAGSAFAAADAPLPATLAETERADAVAFTPAWPLWSDGMEKRRRIYLPPGSAIDKSDPDAWDFPRGTRAWKEFRRDGHLVETRFIERLADGSWRFLTYAWNEDGTKATLAPDGGIPERGIPSRADCLACHEGARSPLLGYSAVQLEAKLEPALGYLHGNCGHCHNERALPALGLELEQSAAGPAKSAARTRESLSRLSRLHAHGGESVARAGLVVARMKSHDPLVRMPPLGVDIVDEKGVALVGKWIEEHIPKGEAR
jgi:hypothetical protein